MKAGSVIAFLIVMVWASSMNAQTFAVPEGELHQRHQQALNLLPDKAAVVLRGSSAIREAHHRYIPEANFLWFTGYDQPLSGFMLFAPGTWSSAPDVASVLFVDNNYEKHGAQFDTVLPIDQFNKIFASLRSQLNTVFINAIDPDFVFDWLNNKGLFLQQNSINAYRNTNKNAIVLPIERITSSLRSVKSLFERVSIGNAIRVTAAGISKAMQEMAPGMSEYQIQALIEFEMKKGGAITTAFPSIVGSGVNGLILHHEVNGRQTVTGDLVVMDVGAWYNGYSADITRTVPVNGRFTAAQKELYDLVLLAQLKAIELIKPGSTLGQLQKVVQAVFDSAGYPSRYMPHGVSHSLGIATHDVIDSDTLREGMIITIEPGLYIPTSDTTKPAGIRGCGIRIEDDMLVTADGCEVLSVEIPKTTEEIERAMNDSGKK